MKNRDQVKWNRPNGTTATGEVFIHPKGSFILQHASILSGDGTQAERLAARNADLASRFLLKDGGVIHIDGTRYLLHYRGDFSDAFDLVPQKSSQPIPRAEKLTLDLILWKEQVMLECESWAKVHSRDKKLIDAYKAGASAGWDKCLDTLKLHSLLNIN